jgi:hypothetical protein
MFSRFSQHIAHKTIFILAEAALTHSIFRLFNSVSWIKFNNFCLNSLVKNTTLETNGMRSCVGTTSFNRFTE